MGSEAHLRRLPMVRDSLSFLYIEHARIEQDDSAIAIHDAHGQTHVPCASLLTIVLGPGTTITHAAIKSLADTGCQVAWVGDGMTRFYASGAGETRSTRNLMRQALSWADPHTHLLVAHRMYAHRFGEDLSPDVSLKALRGFEGQRVRKAYAAAANRTGIEWHGRTYRRTSEWDSMDPANQALSIANAYLYAVCRAALISMGYSPGLGFIHTGHALAFVHDVADLYKLRYIVPMAFLEAAKQKPDLNLRLRRACREMFVEVDLVGRVVEDLESIFDLPEIDSREAASEWLWQPDGKLPAVGHNYADDEPEDLSDITV